MSLEMSAGEFQIDFRAEGSAETARKQLLVSYYNKRVLIRVLIFDKGFDSRKRVDKRVLRTLEER